MTDLQSAIALVQLERLEELTARRRANADYFNRHIHTLQTPTAPAGYGHVWHQYTVRVPANSSGDSSARDAAVVRLERAGIGTGIYYPLPLHQQQSLRRAAKISGRLSVAEQAAYEVLSLPVHPLLTQEELEQIVSAVNRL